MDSFRSTGVVVFADTRKDSGAFPPGVGDVRTKAGNTIPMVFVTTSDGSRGIEGISYDVLKSDMRKAIRELKKSLAATDVVGSEGVGEDGDGEAADEDEDSGEASGLLAKSQVWTNAEGREIVAAIRKVDGDVVEFILDGGRVVRYPIAKLSTDSQRRIEELEE